MNHYPRSEDNPLNNEDNPLNQTSSPKWLCGDLPAMDGQWRSSRIVSVVRSVNTLCTYVMYIYI